jgi:hypothetical protein
MIEALAVPVTMTPSQRAARRIQMANFIEEYEAELAAKAKVEMAKEDAAYAAGHRKGL